MKMMSICRLNLETFHWGFFLNWKMQYAYDLNAEPPVPENVNIHVVDLMCTSDVEFQPWFTLVQIKARPNDDGDLSVNESFTFDVKDSKVVNFSYNNSATS